MDETSINTMQEKPLFSVLIANYNNGRYLQEAIDSVLAQTYSHWEIIIVDDGSTDDSQNIYDKYTTDSRFHIYYNGTNKGCGCTKRICTELSHGEICGFLDADDILLPDAIEAHVDAHLKHSEVSIVYSRNYFCDRNGKILKESPIIELPEGDSYFNHRWAGAMNFASYKNAFYRQTSGISARLKAGVDQDLYFKVEEVGAPFVLNKFMYKYMQRSTASINSNDIKLWYWNMEVRRDACVRRGLDVDKELYSDWEYIAKLITKNAVFEKEKQIRASLPYKVGKIIVKPLESLKGLFKKNNS